MTAAGVSARYSALNAEIIRLQAERDKLVTDYPCDDFSPSWFAGQWRDWHRGHGCYLDDGRPRTAEGAAEIAGSR